jgi:hypothetical protein
MIAASRADGFALRHQEMSFELGKSQREVRATQPIDQGRFSLRLWTQSVRLKRPTPRVEINRQVLFSG